MSSIKKFATIENIGFFTNFEWPNGLAEFKRFNLIYGWNGSGKTTLSRLLRYLENNEFSKFNINDVDFNIVMDDKRTVKKENANDLSESICVFNVDFVNHNIRWSEGTANRLLLIGAMTANLSNDLRTLKDKKNKTTEDIETKKNEKETADKEKDKLLTENARTIKSILTTSAKQDNYNNYNRSPLSATLDDLLSNPNPEQYKLTDENDKKRIDLIRQQPMGMISAIKAVPVIEQSILTECEKILETTPLSPNPIEKLKLDTILNDWVSTGYNIYKEKDEKECQFCLQPIPNDRLKALEQHFSKEYENFIDKINNIKDKITSYRSNLDAIKPHDKANLFTHLQEEYVEACNNLNAEKQKLLDSIHSILEKLDTKRNNPFAPWQGATDSFAQVMELSTATSSHLERVNNIINKHNDQSKDLSKSIGEAKKDIEYHKAYALLEEYKKINTNISNSERDLVKLGKELTKIKEDIKKIEDGIIQPKIAENKINDILSKFLGRSDIALEYENDGYIIKRNDQQADNLSEGEKNAIALIYFLTKIEEGSGVDQKIIVIDDPVSSLDNNSKYAALSYIKNKTENAQQIFFLTHDFYCFREAKRWHKKEDSGLYMLECCAKNDNRREPKIKKIDPLLENYESEYHFLFSKLYQLHCANKNERTLEYIYPLASMGRKVLETFLAFKCLSNKKIEEQLKALNTIDENEQYKLLRFLNTISHADSIDRLNGFSPAPIEEMPGIISSIMYFIEITDKEHFNGMTSIINGVVSQSTTTAVDPVPA